MICVLNTSLNWALIVIILTVYPWSLKAKHPPEILLCKNPEKNDTCVLRCSCEQTLDVVFFKETGSPTGEGACFINNRFKSKDQRYMVFQEDDECCLQITRVNRYMDGGNWYCEHGTETSEKKELIVYTSISHLTLRPLPAVVNNAFNLSAEGYCVYPKSITARLLPSHGQSNHIPIIKYMEAPKECDDGEYSVSIYFNIKPTDFVGSEIFRIEVTGAEGGKSFKSNPTSQVHFQVSDYNYSALCALYIPMMSGLTVVVFIGMNILLRKPRSCASTNLTFIVLNVIGSVASVCIIILASLSLARNFEHNEDEHNGEESNSKCVNVSVVLASLTLILMSIIIIVQVQSRRITNQVKTDTLHYTQNDKDAEKACIHSTEYFKTNSGMAEIEGSKIDIAEMTKSFHDPNTDLSDTGNNSLSNMEMKPEAGDTDPLLGKPNITRSEKYNTLALPALFKIDTAMANRENDSTHIETNKHLTENLENQPSVVEINRKTPTINIEQSDKSDNLTSKVKFSADVDKTDPSVLRVGSHEESYEHIQRTRNMYHMQMGIEHPPEQLSLCVKAEGKNIN